MDTDTQLYTTEKPGGCNSGKFTYPHTHTLYTEEEKTAGDCKSGTK